MTSVYPGGGIVPETGFTGEDRKTLITVEVELGHVRELLTGLGDRIVALERDHVRQEQIHALEIDIDSLRDEKEDKSSGARADIRGLRKDIEDLQRWRWFERGIVATAITLGEIILHLVVK